VYDAIFSDIDPAYVVGLRQRVVRVDTSVLTLRGAQLNAFMMTVNTIWLILTAAL